MQIFCKQIGFWIEETKNCVVHSTETVEAWQVAQFSSVQCSLHFPSSPSFVFPFMKIFIYLPRLVKENLEMLLPSSPGKTFEMENVTLTGILIRRGTDTNS